MRSGSPSFNAATANPSKAIQLAVRIDIDGGLWLTSHTIAGLTPAGGETLLDGVLEGVSSLSQKLHADQGRAEIGSLSFSVVDEAGSLTAALKTALDNGQGLKGKKVELYRGDASIDWADYRLEQTQKIHKQVKYGDGLYDFDCADIQREMRRDIFDPAKTFLAAEFATGATTLTVQTTADFEACPHTASFTDAPSQSVYYLKIKYQNGYEIVRATGKTATTFTGCVRGLFGTTERTHELPGESGSDEGIEVEEYVYLEMPAPQLAYALLTGQILGGGTLPARWHLGISTAFVTQADFETIGADWYNASNLNQGVLLRFDGPKKQDGKAFIEKEINLCLGAYMPVQADGALGFKRMARVLRDASAALVLDETVVIKHGDLTHDLDGIRNVLDISWAQVQLPGDKDPKYLRRNIISDAVSIGLYGAAKAHALKFSGLHNARHTISTLNNRFDALRDRYTHPPLTLSLDLLPSVGDLEVGDVVRVQLPTVRDFTTGAAIDRAMEVQRVQVNQLDGLVQVDLFGSSGAATPIADSIGTSAELPDGWYNSTGAAMSASLSITGDILQADGTLTGGTTSRTVFYHLGDFTVPSGRTLTITGNAELRVRGHLQVDGLIVCTDGQPANTAGFIGSSRGGAGRVRTNGYHGGGVPNDLTQTTVVGQNASLPPLDIVNDAGTLVGIPGDMRGSGGGRGGKVVEWSSIDSLWVPVCFGGAGGAGGGSVVSVSRGAAFGAAGKIHTSGAAGNQGNSGVTEGGATEYAGSGGGGAPGGVLLLIDGSGVTVPLISNAIVANHGASPTNGGLARTVGTNGTPMGAAAARVLYVPKSRTPYPNYSLETSDVSAELAALQRAVVGGTPLYTADQRDTPVAWPTSTTIGSASTHAVSAPAAGSGFLHVLLNDASGGVRVALNGTELAALTGAAGVTQWHTVECTYTSGSNTVAIWAPDADAGTVHGVVSMQGGAGDPQSILDAAAAIAAASAAATDAADALAAASSAEAAADGKIVTFYQTSTPSGANLGDLWFDTDDGNKVYRYNGSSWVVTQDTAIANAVNTAQNAQTIADGKAIVHYQTNAPTGKTSGDTGDIWIDTNDNNKMYVYSHPSWVLAQDYYTASLTATWGGVTGAAAGVLSNIAGRGVNLVPPAYARFGDVPPMIETGGSGSHSWDAGNNYVGGRSLKLACTGAELYAYLGATSSTYNVPIHAGVPYIVSAYVKCSHSSRAGEFFIKMENGTHSSTAWVSGSAGSWTRISAVITPSGSGSAGIVRVDNNGGSGVNMWFAGIMVEEQQGTATAPSAFNGGALLGEISGQITDQTNLPQVQTGGGGTAIGTGSPLTAADVGATATITVAAHSRQYGFGAVSLNGGSIAGLGFNTKYHVYYDDPFYVGGAVTYYATTSVNTAMSGNGRVYLTYITTPADGAPPSTPPPAACVALDQWLWAGLQVCNARAGDWLDAWSDGPETHPTTITQAIAVAAVPCVEIVTESGAAVVVSATSPVETFDHITLEAQCTLGALLGVVHGDTRTVTPEKVTAVNFAGERDVLRISCGDISYAAGTTAAHRVITHNSYNKP